MDNSYKYFKNTDCKYFPCHEVDPEKDFNCLFCYCPMNPYKDCPGTPRYIRKENGVCIKDCSGCVYPHLPGNYDKIISFLSSKINQEQKP